MSLVKNLKSMVKLQLTVIVKWILFSSEGQFTIGGLLSADEININIHGTCRAKEIGGQTIKVRHRSGTFSRLFKTVFGLQLEAELLEGDNIDIDYAHIRTVRGNNVTVGANCEIELIEYTGVLTVDKKCKCKKKLSKFNGREKSIWNIHIVSQ